MSFELPPHESLTIQHNPHWCCGCSIKDYLLFRLPKDRRNAEEMKKIIEAGSLWTIEASGRNGSLWAAGETLEKALQTINQAFS